MSNPTELPDLANSKEAWIEAATEHLRPYMPACTQASIRDYADSLYQNYVVEDDPDCTPAAAVEEDITYWGD